MPTYYKATDGKTEQLVSDLLNDMGWLTRRTDASSRWDIEALRVDMALVVEVKRRNMDWGQYPTVFIDKSKVDVMRKRASDLHGDAILVIVPNDMVPRFARLDKPQHWKMNTINVSPNRLDPSDRGDLKYEIPIDEFKELGQL